MSAISKYLTIIGVALLGLSSAIQAQVPVQVSQLIETYEGKAYYLHTVEAQQTLYSIAKAYGVTVENILLNNPDARRGLRVNQVIRIPASASPAQQPQNQPVTQQQGGNNEAGEFEYIYHVAGKNETFAYAASVYMVPERRIRDANPNRSEPFREGDYILIPIQRKDRRQPITESPQLRRSGFDPYDTPSQRQQSGPTRRDLVDAANTPNTPSTPRQTQASTTTAAPAAGTTPRQSPAESNSGSANRQSAPATQTSRPAATPLMPDNVPTEQTSYQSALPSRHIVRPQETLYSIARQYNMTTAQLQQANPGLGENIQVGQVLLLPADASSAGQTQQNTTSSDQGEIIIHTVERGETLFRISRNYGITIEELKRLNPGLTENLATGQKIRVLKKKISQPYLVHHIEKEQKTKQLAKDFGLTPDELQRANPSIGKNVFPNQEVKIPLQTKPFTESKQPDKSPEPLMPAPIKKPEKDLTAEVSAGVTQAAAEASDCRPDPSNEQTLYRVALLLPLYLSETPTAMSFAGRSASAEAPRGLSFAQFYQGFVMAADSLAEHFGLRTELLILDVDQSSGSVQQALADPRLRQANLIIGPFFSQAFEQVAAFARNNKIPIVNPVTQRRQVLDDNPFVIKLRPDQSSLFGQLAQTMTMAYPEASIIIMHAPGRNLTEATQLTEAFEQAINRRKKVANSDLIRALSGRNSGPAFIQAGSTYLDLADLRARPYDSTLIQRKVTRLAFARNDLGRFREIADTWRNNIVVVYSDDRAYAMDVLNRLNQVADEYNIQLVGLPDWRKFDNLFIEHTVRLNMHLTDAVYVDYENLKVQFFIQQYRSRFGIEPNTYAFEGFDTGWYFLQMLQRRGKDFMPCLPEYSTWLMTNTFRFSRASETSGFENQQWNISRLRNYRYEPLNIP
ncbi:MAG TPA: LysM peptidoglycan-binding domain-containing protein [Bacteroidales bacterium]|nr:LysM peptidoglycan-binding domain-containing protein [Bacteroidales bacterium]